MPKKTRAERRREKSRRVGRLPLSQKIKPFLSFKHPATRFCVLFLGLLVFFSIVLYQEPTKQHFNRPVTGVIASQAAWILKILGMKVHASGIAISGEGFGVQIMGNCNAIFETVLFLSAVLTFPASLKYKLVGGLLGTVFIYLLNLFRVVLLFLVGVYTPQYFVEGHVYVSQSIFIIMVAIFWLLWVKKSARIIPVR